MSGKTVRDYFDGWVESITIKVHTSFASIAGTKEQDYGFKKTKGDVADFYISCPNKECTQSFIDLRNIVGAMVAKKETNLSGETTCCGRIAPDHPNQNCDARIEYSIHIQYTQS